MKKNLQLGLGLTDTNDEPTNQIPADAILTEDGDPITTESGEILTEE